MIWIYKENKDIDNYLLKFWQNFDIIHIIYSSYYNQNVYYYIVNFVVF